MAAADAETPAGNQQGCQMKKYVLTKVINQITARRARPIYNDLQGRFSAHRSARQKQKNCGGPQSLSQRPVTSASRLLACACALCATLALESQATIVFLC